MKKYFFIFILVGFPFLAYSQNLKAKRNQLLDYLFFTKEPLQEVNSNHNKNLYYLELPDKKLQFDRHIFIRSKNTLFLIIEGTGMVFKGNKYDETFIEFERIDSTVNFGYNFLAINLCHKDTLFSFGGYGFWKFNGQLRYFMNNQWNISPVNKELNVIDHINYFDRKDSKLYSISHIYGNEAEKKKEPSSRKSTVICTDLLEKNNSELGDVMPELKNMTESYILWKSTQLEGPVITFLQNAYLINFKKNRIYKSTNRKIFDNLVANFRYQTGYIFQNNDTVYYVRSNNKDSLFHFTIGRSDFETEGLPLYSPSSGNINTSRMIKLLLGFILMAALTIGLLIKLRKSKKTITVSHLNSNTDLIVENNFDISKFSDFDIHVINAIIKEKIIPVETLNHILGLSKKSLEIQKKSRNDVIHRINHKFKVILNTEVEFIERIRSEEDRRYFKYTINEANQQLFKDHQKNIPKFKE